MKLFFDTETTSLYPGQICQLSYVLDDGICVRGKNFFFSVDEIDPSSAAVNGLSVELLAELSGGKRFEDCVDEIATDFENADLFAHNFNFDYSFLQAEFSRLGKLFRYRSDFCTMRKYTPVLKLPRNNGGYKFPKLSELMRFCGVTEEDAFSEAEKLFGGGTKLHDARADAVAVWLCVKWMEKEKD